MFIYQIAEINKLGEYDATYGQRYWGKLVDDLTPISFNSQRQDFQAGETISCEEKIMKKSKKGTTYWQLKKVNLVEDGTSSQPAPEPAPEKPATEPENAPPVKWEVRELSNLQPQLDLRLSRIEAKLDKLLGLDESLSANMDNTLEEALPTETDMPEDFLV